MRRYIKYIVVAVVIIILIIAIGILVTHQKKNAQIDDGKFKIVTSFYPIYIMTANITEGAKDIELVNMTDTNVGCIHNYTLTTQDMKKIERADVLIENGLGLESFNDKMMNINKDLQILDSSQNLQNLIVEENKTNPHIWTSITNYIAQVENITKGLIEANPENTEIYEKNSKEYIGKLTDLKLRYEVELQLKGQTAVTLNENFAYFGKEIGLNLTVIQTSHEESAISAETLKSVIEMMKQTGSKIIIIDAEDNIKNAETIASETGAKIYRLNSGTTGSMNKEAYINVMQDNLESLKNDEK